MVGFPIPKAFSRKGFCAEDRLELALRELLHEDGPDRLVQYLHETPQQRRKQIVRPGWDKKNAQCKMQKKREEPSFAFTPKSKKKITENFGGSDLGENIIHSVFFFNSIAESADFFREPSKSSTKAGTSSMREKQNKTKNNTRDSRG